MSAVLTRKPNRLKYFDYSRNGYYFVTICTQQKGNILAVNNISNNVGATCGRPILSKTGRLVDNEIKQIGDKYDMVRIDNYIIMPDHIHMIIVIENDEIIKNQQHYEQYWHYIEYNALKQYTQKNR